jgi:hypothetical protein
MNISADGQLVLHEGTMKAFGIKPGDNLLSIRSSNIAIGMIVKGPIIEVAKRHPEIKVFE